MCLVSWETFGSIIQFKMKFFGFEQDEFVMTDLIVGLQG